MRSKFTLTVALAVLGAILATNFATADGVELLEVGESGVSIDLPGGQSLPPVQILPACSDLGDNDGDGAVDLGDEGCSGPLDNDEFNPAPPPPTPPDDPGDGGDGDGDGDGGGDQGNDTPVDTGPLGGSGTTAGGDQGVSPEPEPENEGDDDDKREPIVPDPLREPDGTPTLANPTVTFADFGPTPIGVPNFVIDSFSIPPFLLPIYQACGTEYGIPWQVLASINRIETAFGTNLNVSTAGAVGWMQFIPSTWQAYGVDANNDGRKDPYNPVDAICAAARYLRAAGGESDLATAIFAYNHADWYVDEVLLYARQYGKLPGDLVNSLTGLTDGARFPVAAKARYADDISEREASERAKPSANGGTGNLADVIASSPTRRGIDIFAKEGAPVVAVNDGVIKKIGRDPDRGRYIVLQDAYGNRYIYAKLGKTAKLHPVPKESELTADDFKLVSPPEDEEPTGSATGGGEDVDDETPDEATKSEKVSGPVDTEDDRARLYAFPQRPENELVADLTGQLDELLGSKLPGYESFKAYFSSVLKFDRETMDLEPLEEGSKVVAGTVLGEIGQVDEHAARLHFMIRPTGRGAPLIDPKPILDGWKLLEATAIYRAAGKNPFDFSGEASIGQILLMSKAQLQRRVLNDPDLEIYACGREDIASGQIDRRILATMEYLVSSGFELTITSLKCGHSFYTASGNISHHSSGNAMDIAQVNGIPILGNQGSGSITAAVIEQLLKLQGSMMPAQIISLMDYGTNTFAMGDHADHIHVGFQPLYEPADTEQQFVRLLEPGQWQRLIERIAEIDNPDVPTQPSEFSLPAGKGDKATPAEQALERSSNAHVGE